MKNGIKLTLAAEDFAECYGILILKDEEFMIDIDQSKIPSDFLNRLKIWYEEYFPYTGMIPEELKPHKEHIKKLDNTGIDLLKEIYANGMLNDVEINRFVYYSRGIDEVLIELY